LLAEKDEKGEEEKLGEGGRFGGDAMVQRGRVVGEDKGEDGVVEVVRCDVVRVKLTLSA
jgi:hypothetical protein